MCGAHGTEGEDRIALAQYDDEALTLGGGGRERVAQESRVS